jgi:hypothetical protein
MPDRNPTPLMLCECLSQYFLTSVSSTSVKISEVTAYQYMEKLGSIIRYARYELFFINDCGTSKVWARH